MRIAVTTAIVAVLLVAPAASAHVTLTPTRIEPGADAVVTVVVPNETSGDAVREVSIAVPRGFGVEGAQAPAGFERVGGRTEWQGSLAPGTFAPFAFSGSSRADFQGSLRFAVALRYASGRTERFAPTLLVAPAATADHSTRTLARAALIVALVAAAVAVGAFFLALANWLRGPGEQAGDELQEEKRESVLASKE